MQNVKTWLMMLFTLLQAPGLALPWTVKEIKAGVTRGPDDQPRPPTLAPEQTVSKQQH